MTDLDRDRLTAALDEVVRRNAPHISSKGPVSTSVALARTELAQTLKIEISQGLFDVLPPTEPLAVPVENARSPWTWPLWALIGLLAVVGGGTTIALFLN